MTELSLSCSENRTKPKKTEEKRGATITIPITDDELNLLEWQNVENCLDSIVSGRMITGAERIDPDAILLYLTDLGGNKSVLEVGYDCLTGKFGVFHAKTNERGAKTEQKENSR